MAKEKEKEKVPVSQSVNTKLDECLELLKAEYIAAPKNETYSIMTSINLLKLELKKI